jgi:hypothetical protein
MNFAGFGPAFQGASDTERALRALADAQQQQQARGLLTSVLSQYTQPGQAAPGTPGARPMMPAAGPQPGGVSPPGGAAAPTGAPPGGIGPVQPSGGVSPAPPPAFTSPMDLQKLATIIAQGPGSKGAQGYALQDAVKLLTPAAQQATRLQIADQNNATRQDIAADNRASRERIADANRTMRSSVGAKLKDDPQYRALEDTLKAAQSANAANGTDITYQALLKASDDLNAYAKSKNGTVPAAEAGAKTKPAAAAAPAAGQPQTAPLPDSNKSDPDGTSYPAKDGSVWVKKGDVVVKQ